ncbi:MAG: hypothetical protein H6933_11880 [Burkholderiaceae bacterium]|nr:hypothetical protein [Rhodoferax sp.]MCP5283954.1 hypothetical protein [Burkholderiaceae bacterium]MCP5285588.1 hypothetical protein [Burkholderiaceae bacterium]
MLPALDARLAHAALSTLQRSERLLAELVHRGRAVDLHAILAAAWSTFGTSAWWVADLRERGLIGDAEGKATGDALGALYRAGGTLGQYRLLRVEGRRANVGRCWRLECARG